MMTMNHISDDARKKQEAEQKALKEAERECTKCLKAMVGVNPEAAEKIKQQLNDLLKRYPKLSMDFKKRVLETARTHECTANMRETDARLHKAMAMAHDRHPAERTKLVSEARGFFRKAMALGASKEFEVAATREIESIMLTSAPDPNRPTKAKPMATAPENPHHAKMASATDNPRSAKPPSLRHR